MKKVILLLTLSIISYNFIHSETILSGVLNQNMIWDSTGNPYIVSKNTLIKQGVKVKIEPGVIVKFNSNVYLQVDGELQALGTKENPILFSVTDKKNTWEGIKFSELAKQYNDTLKNGAYFNFCIFESVENFTKTIKSQRTSIKICHCEFNGSAGINFELGAFANLTKNIFRKCESGVQMSEHPNEPNSGFVLLDSNEFYDCGLNSIGSNALITNNIFDGCYNPYDPYNICLRISSLKAIIGNNTFSNLGYALTIEGGDNHEITYNSFENNLCNFVLTCERNPIIENNNFISFKKYNLWWMSIFTTNRDCKMPEGSGTFAEIDVTNNFWGNLKTEEEIEESIFHFNDDFSVKGLFIFKPYRGTIAVKDTIINVNEEIIKRGNFEIYPNPATNKIKIKSNLFQNNFAEIQISNYMGIKIKSKQFFSQNEIELDVSDLPNGIYFATLKSGSNIQTKQFIILR